VRLLVALCIALAAATAASIHAATRPPARVQVTATEFNFGLSRTRVASGPLVVQLLNLGEDPHDLVLRRDARRARTFRIRKLGPDEFADLGLRLGAGRYRLWCSLGDHRQRGMEATLTVRS